MFDIQKQIALSERFQKTKASFSKDLHKYIHAKTVDNFINHIDKFTYDAQKENVYESLSEYIDHVDSLTMLNAETAKETFAKYLSPLTILYSDHNDFHLAIKPFWIILATIFGVLILYFTNVPYYSYFVFIAIILLIEARQIYFQKQKKLYSILY